MLDFRSATRLVHTHLRSGLCSQHNICTYTYGIHLYYVNYLYKILSLPYYVNKVYKANVLRNKARIRVLCNTIYKLPGISVMNKQVLTHQSWIITYLVRIYIILSFPNNHLMPNKENKNKTEANQPFFMAGLRSPYLD
jgi:hypothetical protein